MKIVNFSWYRTLRHMYKYLLLCMPDDEATDLIDLLWKDIVLENEVNDMIKLIND